ncbi:Wzz/FepE/Etk N-terminal domain-containing protein [Candidatus Thioglobus sp.]|nr:Wzz/FepE/Etk N-terminal domain-containing protein [Candidatus Thioglobus sp.]
MNDDNSRQYYDDEIDLRQLFKSLKERSRFIFTFTGVVTLLAIGYVLSVTAPPPQYKVEATFLKPSEMSIIRLNQYSLLNGTTETAESVFDKFLTSLNSPVLQRDVFDDGYLKRLQKEGESIVDVDKYITEFIKLILITKNKESDGVGLPHILKTESSNPDVVSEFLDAILTKADKETINYFINTQKLKIANRLTQLTAIRSELINEARQSRLNEIVTLKDAAALASSLSIIENNLNQLNKSSNNMNLNIAIQSGTNIPDWYLYGETALLKMIDSLESRSSDEAFIPQLLKLDSEMLKLKSIRPDSTDINAVQLYQSAYSEIIPTKSKNRLIIALAFIGSFMLSILLVFLMNAFKEENVTSIQKGK